MTVEPLLDVLPSVTVSGAWIASGASLVACADPSALVAVTVTAMSVPASPELSG